MADIGSLNGFDFSAVRNPGTGQQPNTLEQERIQSDLQRQVGGNTQNVETESRAPAEARRTQDANADRLANGQTQAEAATGVERDQVVLSQEATQALANDNSVLNTVSLGELNPTNQNVRDESSNAQVDGNQDSQSEQSRTLGQFVDQFA